MQRFMAEELLLGGIVSRKYHLVYVRDWTQATQMRNTKRELQEESGVHSQEERDEN